jgi:hypothetical protein
MQFELRLNYLKITKLNMVKTKAKWRKNLLPY